jgi:site-specific recombinase XerD
MASRSLSKYVADYTCSSSFNRKLFEQLVSTLDWNQIRATDDRRLRCLGRFLQQHKITAPLTWEHIFSLMPPLPPTHRNVPKMIRKALLDIGHMCAERGELEPYQQYIARRNALAPIAHAPLPLHPLLYVFSNWLRSRQAKATTIHHHLAAVSTFWLWCFEHDVKHPQAVTPSNLTAYLLGLYWQWRCQRCAANAYCADESEKAPGLCSQCQSTRTMHRKQRYSQNHIRRIRASLFTFFEWAVLAKRAMINPVQRKVAAPHPRIEHYSPEILRQICDYIPAPDADPIAALLLYLIIFHLTTVKELRELRIPASISLDSRRNTSDLAACTFLILPKREPSLGIIHRGRPGGRINFHHQAESWLRPLLTRFEDKRTAMLHRRSKNQYLFVASRGLVHDTPVGHVWIWSAVKRITYSILGYSCDPNTLRKTAAIYFADRVGAGILSRMGWHPVQAFAYTWVPRLLRQPTKQS